MHALFDPSLLLGALLIWSAQVVLLVAAGALAAEAIPHPKGRLALWQGVLLLMLLLPAIEPWSSAPPAAAPPLLVAPASTATAAIAPVTSRGTHWRTEYWLWLIAAGAGLRLLWVAAGFLRLQRYRKQARPLAGPPLRFACDVAAWYASDSVPGPVTYGWRRPVILLPSRVLDLPIELSEAIECHELIHVRRNDWLWVLGETLVRSLLWFHPAVWFVAGRIQLTREQVVDREAVSLLQNRDGYLDALVAVADYRLRPDLAPAPSFLRKRHLMARVEAVMKEVDMSRSRMAAGAAAACSALTMAVGAAMWLFPFVGSPAVQAQTAPDSPGITVDAGGALLHRAPVRIPAGSTATGTVTVQATLDAKGEVTDAHVVSGPDELRREALTSVLQWHYQPGPSSAQISIQFGAPAKPTQDAAPVPLVAASRQNVSVVAPRPVPPPPPAPGTFPATIKAIQFQGVSPDAEKELRGRLPIREGDTVSQSDIDNLRGAVRAFDGHLVAGYALTAAAGGGSDLTVQVRVTAQSAPVETAVKVSPGIQDPKLIQSTTPVYPAIAKQARIQGTVVLDVIIGADGSMQQMKLVSSANPLLTPAAMDAVKHWTYQPTILNNQPVAVATTVTVNFSLQ